MASISHTEPGTLFVRTIAALGLNRGGAIEGAARYAAERWGDTPAVGLFLSRAAESAIGWDDGGSLTAPGTSEFLNLVRPRTVLGRLARLRKVAFHEGAAIVTAGATYAWVAEGAAIPVAKPTWTPASLPMLKIGGISVVLQDLLKLTSPAAETSLRDELVDGLAEFLDESFLSADAEVVGEQPAGATNGASSTASVNPAADIKALLGGFDNLAAVTIVASEGVAVALAQNGAFRDGKIYETIPLLTSNAAGDRLIAIDARRVLYADEGGLSVEVAREGALEMDNDPQHNSTTPTATTLVSLFQTNSVAVRLRRYVNWDALSGSVAVVTGAAY